jgi:transcriptional regulator with XRE-family HTH domain
MILCPTDRPAVVTNLPSKPALMIFRERTAGAAGQDGLTSFLLACQHAKFVYTRVASAETVEMRGFGERLRARAHALGLTDSEVARRIGLGQGRYSNYVNDIVEPDLQTLVRILRALDLSADEALGLTCDDTMDSGQILRSQIVAAAESIEPELLSAVAAMFNAAASAAHPKAAVRLRRRPKKEI